MNETQVEFVDPRHFLDAVFQRFQREAQGLRAAWGLLRKRFGG